MKYVIYDTTNSEFLRKYSPSQNKCWWGGCYHVGTQNIKLDEDIPYVIRGKKIAEAIKGKILRKYPEYEPDEIRILKAQVKECVIIDY